jgi:hypothetical protein
MSREERQAKNDQSGGKPRDSKERTSPLDFAFLLFTFVKIDITAQLSYFV